MRRVIDRSLIVHVSPIRRKYPAATLTGTRHQVDRELALGDTRTILGDTRTIELALVTQGRSILALGTSAHAGKDDDHGRPLRKAGGASAVELRGNARFPREW